MTEYRERLTAPISWWLAAVAFAVVWGWILLVVTTWAIAVAIAVLVALFGLVAVWRYGSVLIEVHPQRLIVGRASIASEYVGSVAGLDRSAYRHRLGLGADARAHLVTRPYLDRGVLVWIEDDDDPAPYWLVSSRRPEAFAAALGHTGHAPPRNTIREATRGKEA